MYPTTEETAFLNGLIEEPSQGYMYWNMTKEKLYFSNQFQEILGFTISELQSGDDLLKIIHPEDQPHALRCIKEILSGNTCHENSELRVLTKKRGYIRVSVNSKALDTGFEKPSRTIITIIREIKPENAYTSATENVPDYEITFSNRAVKSEKSHPLSVEALPLPSLLIGTDTNQILDANLAAGETFGYSLTELKGMRIDDLSLEPQKTLQTIREIHEGKPYPSNMRWYKKKDGTPIPLEVSLSKYTDREETIVCMLVRNISKTLHDKSQQVKLTRSLHLILNELKEIPAADTLNLPLDPPVKELFNYGITDLEKKIIQLIVRGYKNKEIAFEIHAAEITVKKHVSLIFQKTGVKNRMELSRFAVENRLVQ